MTGSYPLRLSKYFFDDPDTPAPGHVIVDFENLATPGMLRETPSGYSGFDWQYIVTTHERAYGLRGHLNNTVSGQFMAYTSSGHPGWVSLKHRSISLADIWPYPTAKAKMAT